MTNIYSALNFDLRDFKDSPVLFGLDLPTTKELKLSEQILGDAPKDVDPLVVAQYFESVSAVNEDGEFFNAEWSDRANPVIVAFFVETKTVPDGDETAWCAAFMNWCLARANFRGTDSALSGTFRCYSRERKTPLPGDIAVFGKTYYPKRGKGFGHVAFFVEFEDNGVQVLGGNQSNRVKQSIYPYRNNNLTFLSCRKPLSN